MSSAGLITVWPFGKLGYAPYLLAIGFFLLSCSAIAKFIDIKKFAPVFSAHVYFHIGLLVLCLVRTIAFGVLSFYSVSDHNADGTVSIQNYAFFTLMFTIPEFVCIVIFTLLFFNWLEIFIFSHDQFMFSFESWRRRWIPIFFFFVIFFLLVQFFFYLVCLQFFWCFYCRDYLSENH